MMQNQLNPFEIKAEVLKVISKLEGVGDFASYEVHFRKLDAQHDKKFITRLLFKELNTSKETEIIKFLLKRYTEQQDLIDQLWVLLKSGFTSNQVKIAALDLLRELDTTWTYEVLEGYVDAELLNEDTKRLLDSAIVNPEVQIDFLDFINSLGANDKTVLLESLAQDYDKDELANILIPVFLSRPDSEEGRTALRLLGESKSMLAFHALNSSLDFVNEELVGLVKKNLSVLKMAGIREDSSLEFYKKLLKGSKPYRFCMTYPDGHGNIAIIFSRLNAQGKVKFVAIVADDYHGIRDCFGFNEISKFECNTIIDRFYRADKALEVSPAALKAVLQHAEQISKKSNNWFLPYEYVCWRTLLADIEPQTDNIKEFLEGKLKKTKLSKAVFETILTEDFLDLWFLNETYSTEFEGFMSNLNAVLARNENIDLDVLINEDLDNIFYPDEEKNWSERILMSAYLKLQAGETAAAQAIYSLYFDKKYKTELFRNIIRKSIYECYVTYREKVGVDEHLDRIITKIEKKWVKDA